MNCTTAPGTGDYEAFEATSALDPRLYDDADECDDNAKEKIEELFSLIAAADLARKSGDMNKSLQCIDEIRCVCNEVLE